MSVEKAKWKPGSGLDRGARLYAGKCQLSVYQDRWGSRGFVQLTGEIEVEDFDAAKQMTVAHARRLLTEALAALPEEEA